MATYLCLSMVPESLVASMPPPDEFGRYLAVGTRKQARGPAMFFDLTGTFASDYFDFSRLADHCVAHADGQPKHSDHLRDCFVGLDQDRGKHTKTIDRVRPPEFPYRAIQHGFFLGDQERIIHYPYPSPEKLESKHFFWA